MGIAFICVSQNIIVRVTCVAFIALTTNAHLLILQSQQHVIGFNTNNIIYLK